MKKKKQNPVDEMEKLRQEALAREVDEEIQREKMRALWQKYRFAVIGFVVGVLLVTIGTEIYHSWREKVSLRESDAFENATILAYTGETDKAMGILEELATTGKTGYAPLAKLKLVGVYMAQNKMDQALNSLKALANDTDVPTPIRSVATITYVGHAFDQEKPADLQAMLKPLLGSNSAFAASAAELSAALYLKEGNTQEAVNVLNQALNNPEASQVVKQRLTQLLSVIEN